MNQILEGNPITLGELKAYINSFPDSKDKWPIYVFRLSNPLTGFFIKTIHRDISNTYYRLSRCDL